MIRVALQTYLTRDAARQDVFDYIEMFYNPNRKHTNNGMLSPVDYEKNDVSWTKQVSRKLGAPHSDEVKSLQKSELIAKIQLKAIIIFVRNSIS